MNIWQNKLINQFKNKKFKIHLNWKCDEETSSQERKTKNSKKKVCKNKDVNWGLLANSDIKTYIISAVKVYCFISETLKLPLTNK